MKKRGFTIVELVVAVAVIGLGATGVYGWIWNIIKIWHSDFALSGMFVARCIGVLMAPLGAVLGFL